MDTASSSSASPRAGLTEGHAIIVSRCLPTRERLLHGSDFPFPAAPKAFSSQIGNEAAERITNLTNWIRRDFELKEALGIGLVSAKRSHALGGRPAAKQPS